MSHKSIRLLIERTVANLADDVQFSYATETDFNQTKKDGTILVNLAPLASIPGYRVNGTMNYMVQWNVEIAFYKLDVSSETDKYPLILDELDILVDRFINELNFYSTQADDITISFGTRVSFIKALADDLTGWLVPLQILVADQWDYCRDC